MRRIWVHGHVGMEFGSNFHFHQTMGIETMELHITFPELNLASRRSSLLIVLGSGVIPLEILFADPGWYKQVLPTSVLVDSDNQ